MRLVAVLVALVAAVAFLLMNLNADYQRGAEAAREQAVNPVTLSVALVNEDRGASFAGSGFNLGQSYVKQVESDASSLWSVVSRGVGEDGLAHGKYNLLVVIPSGFSSKVLDINAAAPVPIGVTYQVNANGDARVEEASDAKGREIIKGLSGQLVDMYVASILSNLHGAQRNVRAVVSGEDANVSKLEAGVHPGTKKLGEGLDGLSKGAKGAVSSNEDLTSSLEQLDEAIAASIDEHTTHDSSLSALIAMRASGRLSYGKFLESLMAMNSSLLSAELQKSYDKLVALGESLSTALDGSGADAKGQPNHVGLVEGLRAKVTAAIAAAKERSSVLEQASDSQILTTFRADGVASVDLNADGVITLGELLKAVQGDETMGPLSDASEQVAQFDAFRDLLTTAADTAISHLPYRTEQEVADAASHGWFDLAGGAFQDVPQGITDQLAVIRTFDGYGNVVRDPAGPDLQRLSRELTDAQHASQRCDASPTPTPTPTGTATATPTDEPTSSASATSTPEPSPSVEPTQTMTAAPPGPVVAVQGVSGSPSPGLTAQASATPSQSGPPTASAKALAMPLGGPGATTCSDLLADLTAAAAAYGAGVQELGDDYGRAAMLVGWVADYPLSTFDLRDVDVSGAFDGVVVASVRAQASAEQASLAGLLELQSRIDTAGAALKVSTDALGGTAGDLSTSIASQVKSLTSLRSQMTGILADESVVTKQTGASDEALESAGREASALAASTSALLATTATNVGQAQTTLDSLATLQSDTDRLIEQSRGLGEQSDALVAAVRDQLKGSSAFAESFSTVLVNAFESGVLNEELVRFIANPVAASKRQPVASADVTLPFPWVLILFTVAFAAAYTLARSVGTGAARRSEFASANANWLRSNAAATGLAAGVGLVVGLGVAVLSATTLQIDREHQLVWGLSVVLIGVELVLLSHWLVRQWRAVGAAICVLGLVSYVFVSGAVGAAVSRAGASGVVLAVNPLSHAEAVLLQVSSTGQVSTAALGGVVGWVVACGALNLTVREDLASLLPARWRKTRMGGV